ncbi:MAG: type II secretion system F family protein [Planctomycetota bacterium]|nr:MAG: type II secretion system F family protein [Planctomycetota bacterium]REK42344.1 MAG: type II secretion system F family protein [Planctomycetota bacterium]
MLATTIINFESILPFAIFGLFAVASWWLLEILASGRPKAEQRLEGIRNPSKRGKLFDDGGSRDAGAMTKLIEKATPALSKPLQPQDEASQSKLKQRLSCAGFRSESAPSIFLGMKFLGLIVGLALFGAPMLLISGFSQDTLIKTVLGAAGLFFLPDAIIWFITKQRKDAIFFGLPDALDLMVVCVEAGLGLDQAMRKVAEEMKKTFRVISDEFGLCNFQLQMGRARSEVLKDLGDRTGVEDLRSLAAILIQADKFGSSIAQALRVQSDSMRTRRRQLAEEKAAKTAVKLIFPLVIFIFPGIFVILVGPAAITMVREMFPAMQGG